MLTEYFQIEYLSTGIALLALYVVIRYYLHTSPVEDARYVSNEELQRSQRLIENYDVQDGNQMKPSTPRYAACDSTECVRCRKYTQLRIRAKQKLTHMLRHDRERDLARLSAALTDEHESHIFSGEQRPNVLYIKELTAKPWWEASYFKTDIDALENNLGSILEEVDNLMTKIHTSNSGWTKNSSETGCWFTYYLYNQGQKLLNNTSKLPLLEMLVENHIPNAMLECVFGNVLISVMAPGTCIEPHYGPCNIRVRCHLGLHCPRGWSITVNGERDEWQEGKCILFDDSYLHYVTCDSTSVQGKQKMPDIAEKSTKISEDDNSKSHDVPTYFMGYEAYRVLLIVDLWHPDLTGHEKEAISDLLAF